MLPKILLGIATMSAQYTQNLLQFSLKCEGPVTSRFSVRDFEITQISNQISDFISGFHLEFLIFIVISRFRPDFLISSGFSDFIRISWFHSEFLISLCVVSISAQISLFLRRFQGFWGVYILQTGPDQRTRIYGPRTTSILCALE